ncbi:signal peptidase II [Thalassobacillus devorans]|uniref:signal peptidase II n=1 Tax=Thalassobacillus devorans TaxID=279813 RepID=UPI000A1CA8EE|nr:signal peptidase II [Thalassobacillus devorans]
MVWYYIIASFVIVLDQWSKWMVVKNMYIGESLTIIENFFYLTSHRNRGAAWGILQGQMIFFYIVTLIVVGVIIYYMHQYGKKYRLAGIALSLLLAGAIGNFIDRLIRKEVVDFFDFIIFTYDYPIFNIADSSLVVGVILVIIASILDERKKKESTQL